MKSLSINEPQVTVTALEEIVQINVNDNSICVSTSETGPQGPRGTQVLSGTTDPSLIIGLIGDQYLNTSTGYIFGPKTESGWGSGVLLGSGLKISDVSYTHYQPVALSTWSITHTLDFTPNIIVVDLDGKVIEGDYQYSGDTITANFSNAITGAAYLS
jgi:hypothetical protein